MLYFRLMSLKLGQKETKAFVGFVKYTKLWETRQRNISRTRKHISGKWLSNYLKLQIKIILGASLQSDWLGTYTDRVCWPDSRTAWALWCWKERSGNGWIYSYVESFRLLARNWRRGKVFLDSGVQFGHWFRQNFCPTFSVKFWL